MAKFYEAHRSGNDGFMIAKDRRQYFPPHFHQNVEIFVCLSGSQEITIDGKTFVAEENSVVFIDSFMVRLFSSSAIRNPNTEIIRAVVFKNHGIVRTGMLVGGILYEMTNPAKMLPNARRLIGFMRSGSFSLMEIRGGKRGFVIVTK